MPRGPFIVLRLLVFGFFYFTSLYSLLTYTPFTYTHVIQAGIIPWLLTFTQIHKWLFIGSQVVAAATLWSDFRAPRTRRLAIAYVVIAVAASIALVVHPILPTLGNDNRSFVWSQIALVPPLLVAILDHLAVRGKISWRLSSAREDESIFRASVACMVVAFVTYGIIFHVRASSTLDLSRKEEAIGLLWSLLLHATFVGGAFLVWSLTRGLAGWTRGLAGTVEYTLIAILALVLFAMLARNMVFTSISLKGPLATTAAFTWGIAVTTTVSGIALRGAAATQKPVESGLRLFFSPLALPNAHIVVRAIWFLALTGLAVKLQILASAMDVNGLNQKLCACLIWIMLFAAAVAIFRPRLRASSNTFFFIGMACVGALTYRTWRSLGRPADSVPVLEKLAAAEPSFGLLYDLAGSAGKSESMGELNEFMQRNTSIPHDRHLAPLDVRFVGDLSQPLPGVKPHVFIFVVDSLRRDYLSPFNPAVTFTPSLDKFAKSSDVFTNAFTHYGATGLSEPSIWVGGMMPHKQYIQPFLPMNSLEKLLIAEHYVRFVSVDSILVQILDQSASLIPLDVNTVPGNYDLCATLEELQGKLSERKNQEQHFFAYSQPQNIHVSRIAREGTTVLNNAHFPGFYDPYASRLQRIDACFGKFIDYLQAEKLYDESVVVFTADHGDLLGEEGRWGHAYNLNPEVVRIPLIIHRPERLKGQAVDTSAVAFSTDIAPSIYRLFGYMPGSLGAGFGQSLYGPRTPDRDWHMLVSSYGPVYGILEEKGTRLYVADAVNYTETYYEVGAGSTAARDPVNAEVRSRNAPRILAGVKELHDTFHVEELSGPTKGAAPPPPPAPSH